MFNRRKRSLSVAVTVGAMSLVTVFTLGTATGVGATSNSRTIPAKTIAAAVAALRKLEARPQHIQTTTKVGKPIPTGKTIDWIVCGSPLCTVLTGPLEAAAKVLGWKVDAIPGGLSPETIVDAWKLAVQNKPAGVMASGFPEIVFSSELAQLKAAHIPVVNGFVTDPPSAGYTPVVSRPSEYNETGKAMADYALGTGGTATNALFVYGSTFAADIDVEAGYAKESKSLCPSCGLTPLNVPESDVGTTLPSVVTAALRTHPKVNTVILGEGSFEAGLPQALDSAGFSHIKVVGQYPTQGSLQDLKNGKIAALVMTEQADAMWQMTDAMARALAGVSTSPSEISSPVWVVTKATANKLTVPYYVVSNYQAQYEKLWGK